MVLLLAAASVGPYSHAMLNGAIAMENIPFKKLHCTLLKVLLLPFSDQFIPFGDYMEVWLVYSDMLYTK